MTERRLLRWGALKTERDSVSRAMKNIIHRAADYENLRKDYDGQTEQLNKEGEKLEGVERAIRELTKRLQTDTQQHEQCASEREDLMVGLDTLQNNVGQMEELQGQLHKQEQHLQQTAQELSRLHRSSADCTGAQQTQRSSSSFTRMLSRLHRSSSSFTHTHKDTQTHTHSAELSPGH